MESRVGTLFFFFFLSPNRGNPVVISRGDGRSGDYRVAAGFAAQRAKSAVKRAARDRARQRERNRERRVARGTRPERQEFVYR